MSARSAGFLEHRKGAQRGVVWTATTSTTTTTANQSLHVCAHGDRHERQDPRPGSAVDRTKVQGAQDGHRFAWYALMAHRHRQGVRQQVFDPLPRRLTVHALVWLHGAKPSVGHQPPGCQFGVRSKKDGACSVARSLLCWRRHRRARPALATPVCAFQGFPTAVGKIAKTILMAPRPGASPCDGLVALREMCVAHRVGDMLLGCSLTRDRRHYTRGAVSIAR